MQLGKLISAYKNKYFPKRLQKERVIVMGKELVVFKDTIPEKNDKDDAWYFAMAKHHEAIFDIGAHIGYSSILASLYDPNKVIVLVDPNMEALKYAEQNFVENNMATNKTFINCFVGDTPGEKIKFYTIGIGAAGSMFASHSVSAKMVNAWTWVASRTIDDIVAETGVVPDLAKIDVEAAESKTLQGALRLAALQKTKFFVEMHAPPEMPMLKNASLIQEWCRGNNYKAYYLRDHCEMTVVDMIADRGRCHLLLLPASMPYPEYLKSIQENDTLPANL